jgi:hypothetical protein
LAENKNEGLIPTPPHRARAETATTQNGNICAHQQNQIFDGSSP